MLTHAVMDALLGAAALGDIGKLFPDNDDKYLGADSIGLLKKVLAIIKDKGYKVVNIDSTIIAQRPKLSPYIDKMRETLAASMEIGLDCVSVKATTEEKLGFSGAELGIAAHAVALID